MKGWRAWARAHFRVLADTARYLGIDAGLPVRLEVVELRGAHRLVLTARLAGAGRLSAAFALRLNAGFAGGAIVVEDSDRLFRRVLVLGEVRPESLVAAVELLAREALGVQRWLDTRAPSDRPCDALVFWVS